MSGQLDRTYNLQNIYGKLKKINQIRQDHATIISVFATFLTASAKHLWRGDWTLGCALTQI